MLSHIYHCNLLLEPNFAIVTHLKRTCQVISNKIQAIEKPAEARKTCERPIIEIESLKLWTTNQQWNNDLFKQVKAGERPIIEIERSRSIVVGGTQVTKARPVGGCCRPPPESAQSATADGWKRRVPCRNRSAGGGAGGGLIRPVARRPVRDFVRRPVRPTLALIDDGPPLTAPSNQETPSWLFWQPKAVGLPFEIRFTLDGTAFHRVRLGSGGFHWVKTGHQGSDWLRMACQPLHRVGMGSTR